MTETKLFDAVERVKPERLFLNRIECYTLDGVSDVEYVSPKGHGWIELKVATQRTADHPLTLGHELTMAQMVWLSTHHRPDINLRSGLLIGVKRADRWDEFLFMPPATAAMLLCKPAPSRNGLVENGAVTLASPREVAQLIYQGALR